MARVRQPYDEPRIVPWLDDRTVEPGEVVTVPDEQLPSWLEAGWQPADKATTNAGRKLLEAGTITVFAELPAASNDSKGEGQQ